MIINSLLMWFLQDLLQVFLRGWMLIPDFMLMFVCYKSITSNYGLSRMIWIAFVGGLCWDLRWAGILGLNALAYTVALILSFWFWNLMPKNGRTPVILAAVMLMGHLTVAVFRLIILGIPSHYLLYQVALQQSYAVVLSIIFGFVFYKRGDKSNAPQA